MNTLRYDVRDEERESSRILIVDDVTKNIQVLGLMLRNKGHEINVARHGKQALSTLKAVRPDLILMDVQMPEMDGFETVKLIKEDKDYRDIPVIFVTARSEIHDMVRAFRAGAADYITKPFNSEEVYTRVENHLKIASLLKSEKQLLEETLSGIVRTLSNLLYLAAPEIFVHTNCIRKYVDRMLANLQPEEQWQYQVAADLSLIGCITIHPDVYERGVRKEMLAEEEAHMYGSYPLVGQQLLERIPRLHRVAAMVAGQLDPARLPKNAPEAITTGAWLLKAALELDRWLDQGISMNRTIRYILAEYPGMPPAIGGVMQTFTEPANSSEEIDVKISELEEGMILCEDLKTRDGTVIVGEGRELDWTLVRRIRNFVRMDTLDKTVRVIQKSHSLPM